jgi:riboflavin synthase
MFTGLVETTGEILAFEPTSAGGTRLTVRSPLYRDCAPGDSVAHNGCCLTVAALEGDTAAFDLLAETLRCTNLGDLRPGDRVNLERSLLPTTRLGGHFVTGHVDTTGAVRRLEPRGADRLLEIAAPADFLRLVVPKGCLAVDGISLTVGEVSADALTLWIIPHTLAATNLGARRPGDRVNLESDLLAKYAAKLLGR